MTDDQLYDYIGSFDSIPEDDSSPKYPWTAQSTDTAKMSGWDAVIANCAPTTMDLLIEVVELLRRKGARPTPAIALDELRRSRLNALWLVLGYMEGGKIEPR
jgi:hypothetical protein